MQDVGVWIGVTATIIIASAQVWLDIRFTKIEKKIKFNEWDSARDAFFADCFILAGDLTQSLVVNTAELDANRIRIRNDMEFPLHEILNRTDHLYSQARINSSGLTDTELCELSDLMSRLRFAANSARDALRCWDVIENDLPTIDDESIDNDEYMVGVGPQRRENPKLNDTIAGKHFINFAKNFRECCSKIFRACDGLYKFSMKHTNDGERVRPLFPPDWLGDAEGGVDSYPTFKDKLEKNSAILLKRIESMDERGLCLLVDRQENVA